MVATRAASDLRWEAMGTTAHAIVHGAEPDIAVAEIRRFVADLEGRWSRFRADSEVSRCNARAGEVVVVHPETAALVGEAVVWWRATHGRFDPTVLGALRAAGYDRTFTAGPGPLGVATRSPGPGGVVVDCRAGTVALPPGVGLDLGGIGKGRAVDLVHARWGHLPGGLIDLGGDLRVWGEPPDGGTGWPIGVEDLRDGTALAVLGLRAGAVATSTTLRRRWQQGDRAMHHLIDPTTGAPAVGEVVSATVVAGTATGAEVLAKAAVLSLTVDAAAELLVGHRVAGLLVPRTGSPVPVGGFTSLCWSGPAAP